MKYLSSVFALLAILASGCASNNLEDYPLYTDHVSKSLDVKSATGERLDVNSEIPNYSKIPQDMAPGYLFSLSHASDSKLSGKYRADFTGILRLPYDVKVDVKNKSFNQVKEEVLTSYKKFFQRGVESVNFTLTNREYWVEVRGMVKKPGRYLVRPSESLDLVIDAAGGVQGDVSVDYYSASIKQGDFDFKVLLNSYFESTVKKDKIRWLGADSIFVSKLDSLAGISNEIPFVSIIGGVQKPGKILHQKDASLYFYIEKAGGLVQGLGYNECYVFRNTPEGVKKINFSFNKPETIPVIYANDTVYMNSQIQTNADVWLQRLSYVAGMISTVALLILAL